MVSVKDADPTPATTTTTSVRRPFNEVVKDNLLVALATDKYKLIEFVMEHLLANRTSTAPRFDSAEIHWGYRVIKGLYEISKGFLSKYIAKISGAWECLSHKLIPAQEIPMRPRTRIRLAKMTTDAHKKL
ncbi:uncharacterized protein LOC135950794 [Calliphora vicina]|uniref:uncharacterized protein LOC135950794 n=1 Tax=Calliphora vicina TaxID=7373 RepID=UPI00325BABE1